MCLNICFPPTDSILSAINVRVLHGSVRRMGVVSGPLLPSLPAVGHASAGRAHVGRPRHRAAGLLLLRHRDEHCCAYITICVC